MKDKNFKKVIIWITYSIFLLFIMLNFKTVWSILSKLTEILNPFFYGFILAFLLNFPYKFFKEKVFKKIGSKRPVFTKIRTPLSLFCSYLIVIGIITTIIAVLIPELGNSIQMLANNLPEYGKQAEQVLNDLISTVRERFNLSIDENSNIETLAYNIFHSISGGDVSKFIENISSNFFPAAFTTMRAFVVEVYNWLVAIIISIYLLINKEKLISQGKKLIIAYTKPRTQAKIFKIIYLINNKCGKFIIGKIVDSLIIGIICFLCMGLFRFDYALLISVVVGITNVIPVFGPFIGAIPSAFLLLIINPIECLWFVVFIIVLQQVDGNIIGPKILGDQIGISSFWIMFSVIMGGGLFGVPGMILGVPFFAVIYCILGENVNYRIKRKHKLSVFTEKSEENIKKDEVTEKNTADDIKQNK